MIGQAPVDTRPCSTQCRHRRSRGPLRPPARCRAAGRPGSGRRWGKLGQVAQRVGEMLGAERWELEVLPDELWHRRPVVGERDLGLGRAERRQVVTPEPAAELQVTVAVLRPRQPPDGAQRVVPTGADRASSRAPGGVRQRSPTVCCSAAYAAASSESTYCWCVAEVPGQGQGTHRGGGGLTLGRAAVGRPARGGVDLARRARVPRWDSNPHCDPSMRCRSPA